MHHFAVYEKATGKVLQAARSTNRRAVVLARRGMPEGCAIFCGEIDPAATYLPGGVPTPRLEELLAITPRQVKDFAGRILSYTDWMDIRAIGGAPVAPEIALYRQAVRDRSGEIEAMEPIPTDFTDPKYWPVAP